VIVFELHWLDSFPRHREVLQSAVDYFSGDDRVIGLLLGGSIVQGTMDEYSDIDLDVIVREEDFDAVFSECERTSEAIGHPLARFIADHLRFGADMYIVLYEGPVKLDLDYRRKSDLEPSWRWKDRRVLKDTDGFLAEIVSKSRTLEPPSLPTERILNLDEKFWTWCWYVFGKIMRGELWEALDGLHGVRTLAVLPLLFESEGLRNEGYRRLEPKLPSDLVRSFENTLAGLSPDSLYNTLKSLISLYIELRGRLSVELGIEFDPEKQTYILDAMKSRWGESGPSK
jgi:hypothetical protein